MVNEYVSSEQAEASSPYASQPSYASSPYPGGQLQYAADVAASLQSGEGSYDTSGQFIWSSAGGQQRYEMDIAARQAAAQEPAKIVPFSQSLVEQRPGYYRPEAIGNWRTQEMVAQGIPMGRALESQRQFEVKEHGGEGGWQGRFYANEMQKWGQGPVEISSAYHNAAAATGVRQAPNPFENVGDQALVFLKGGQEVGKGQLGLFNPGAREMGRLVPQEGLQGFGWDQAVARERGKPAPAPFDFSGAIDRLYASAGEPGPYSRAGETFSNRKTSPEFDPWRSAPSQPGDIAPRMVDFLPPKGTGTKWTQGAYVPGQPGGMLGAPVRASVPVNESGLKLPFISVGKSGAGGFSLFPASAAEGKQVLTMDQFFAPGSKAPSILAGVFDTQDTSKWTAGQRKASDLSKMAGAWFDLGAATATGVSFGLVNFNKPQKSPELAAIDIRLAQPEVAQADINAAVRGGFYTQNKEGGFTPTGKGYYPYGEFSKWGEGASKQLMKAYGTSPEQIATLKKYSEIMPGTQAGLFTSLAIGAATTFVQKPEEIIKAGTVGGAYGGIFRGAGLLSEATGLTGALATRPVIGAAVRYVPTALFSGAFAYTGAKTITREFKDFRPGAMAFEAGGEALLAGVGIGSFGIGYSSPEIVRGVSAGSRAMYKDFSYTARTKISQLQFELGREPASGGFRMPDFSGVRATHAASGGFEFAEESGVNPETLGLTQKALAQRDYWLFDGKATPGMGIESQANWKTNIPRGERVSVDIGAVLGIGLGGKKIQILRPSQTIAEGISRSPIQTAYGYSGWVGSTIQRFGISTPRMPAAGLFAGATSHRTGIQQVIKPEFMVKSLSRQVSIVSIAEDFAASDFLMQRQRESAIMTEISQRTRLFETSRQIQPLQQRTRQELIPALMTGQGSILANIISQTQLTRQEITPTYQPRIQNIIKPFPPFKPVPPFIPISFGWPTGQEQPTGRGRKRSSPFREVIPLRWELFGGQRNTGKRGKRLPSRKAAPRRKR